MMRNESLTLACAALATVLMAGGCGAPAPLSEMELFEEGSTYFENESYVNSIDTYNTLLEQFPFSDKAEIASVKIAHAYYLTGQHDKAIAAFNDFERLYPVSPLLPFVEYTVGMSWLDQALTGDRDKSSSENALRQFERLASRYEGSYYARLASFRMQEAQENLASHELYVGDYYRERDLLRQARRRYEYLLANYPETETAKTAQKRLASLAENAAKAEADGKAKAETPESDAATP